MQISDGNKMSELEIRCLLLAAESLLNEYGVYHSASEFAWLALRDWLTRSKWTLTPNQVAKKYLVLLAKEME